MAARTLLARSPTVSGGGGGSGSWGALHHQLSISPAGSSGSLPNVSPLCSLHPQPSALFRPNCRAGAHAG